MGDALLPPELLDLDSQLAAIAQDAERLVAGLGPAHGEARTSPGSWSVAECLEHLANASRAYVPAMREAAAAARRRGRQRRGPAAPGVLGRWFIRSLEPPVAPRRKLRAPGSIAPRPSPPLADAVAAFSAAHAEARALLRECADLDLSVRFRNPFIPGLRWSLITGFHVIAAHDRRHLWQAWNVRRAVASNVSGTA
jgi:hypothetical protein